MSLSTRFDADADLLFADLGCPATIAVDGAADVYRVVSLVVTGRELVRQAAGHRHTLRLAALLRTADLPPESGRTDWFVQVDNLWFEVVDTLPQDGRTVRLTLAQRGTAPLANNQEEAA